MSDTVVAALVGVGGAVIVAIASVITQLFITRRVINAERERLGLQLGGEEAVRLREKRTDRILDAVSELLEVSDPETGPRVRFGRAIALILRIQLLLDGANVRHTALRDALNNLGERLREYVEVEQGSTEEKAHETRLLFEAQGDVLERTREALAQLPDRAT